MFAPRTPGVEHPGAQQHEADHGGEQVEGEQRAELGEPGRVRGRRVDGGEAGGADRESDEEGDAALHLVPHRAPRPGDAEGEAAVRGGVGDGGEEIRHDVRADHRKEEAQQRVEDELGGGAEDSDDGEARKLPAHAAGQPRLPHPLGHRHPERPREDPPGDPRHAAQVVQRRTDDVDPAVGIVDPVHRHLMDAQAVAFGEQQQFGVEEPRLVLDGGQQRAYDVGAAGLEAALGVGEARGERGPQQQVVRAGDQLALRPAYDGGAARQAAADRQVAVAGHQRRDQRQEGVQVGGQVDVHVGDDVGGAGAPDVPQRPPTPLAVQVDGLDLGDLQPKPLGDRPGAVGARVVRDGDHEAVREPLAEVGVQPPHRGRQDALLVEHGDGDFDEGIAGCVHGGWPLHQSESRRCQGGRQLAHGESSPVSVGAV